MKSSQKIISIRLRFLRGIFLLAIIMFIFSILYFFHLYKSVLKYEKEKITIYNKSIAANIDDNIRNLFNKIKALSVLSQFKNLDLEKINHLIQYNQEHCHLIIELLVCDNRGRKIAATDQQLFLNKKDYWQYDFFNLALAHPGQVILADNNLDQKLLITASTAIIGQNNQIKGIIIAFLNLENQNIQKMSPNVEPDSYQWQVLITNKKGTLLYHSHKKIPPQKAEKFDYINHASFKTALSGQNDFCLISSSKKKWYTLAEFIPISEWTVMVKVPRRLVIDKVFSFTFPNIFLLILLFILSLFLIYFGANQFIHPLLDLTKAIFEYGEFGTTKELTIKGNDELSVAMKSFNQMLNDKKQLDREITELIERERKRIGNELFEQLDNKLNAIYHEFLILKEELNRHLKKDQHYLLTFIDKISQLLNQTIQKTKSIYGGLSPVSVHEDGLVHSIREIIKNYQISYSCHFEFKYDKNLSFKDQLIPLHLYYIINEAIQNAVKYRQARQLQIDIQIKKNNLLILITDNGISAFDDDNIHMSIRMMHYGARLINAELNFVNQELNNQVICTLKDYSLL